MRNGNHAAAPRIGAYERAMLVNRFISSRLNYKWDYVSAATKYDRNDSKHVNILLI
jgi:hypothetical protein